MSRNRKSANKSADNPFHSSTVGDYLSMILWQGVGEKAPFFFGDIIDSHVCIGDRPISRDVKAVDTIGPGGQ